MKSKKQNQKMEVKTYQTFNIPFSIDESDRVFVCPSPPTFQVASICHACLPVVAVVVVAVVVAVVAVVAVVGAVVVVVVVVAVAVVVEFDPLGLAPAAGVVDAEVLRVVHVVAHVRVDQFAPCFHSY
jgi:hypothetical protein